MKPHRESQDAETRKPIQQTGRLPKCRKTRAVKVAKLILPPLTITQVRRAGRSNNVLLAKLRVLAREIQNVVPPINNRDVVLSRKGQTRIPEPNDEPSLSAQLKIPPRAELNQTPDGIRSRNVRILMQAKKRNPNVQLRRKPLRNGGLPSQVQHARRLSPANLRLPAKLKLNHNPKLQPEVEPLPVARRLEIVIQRANELSGLI